MLGSEQSPELSEIRHFSRNQSIFQTAKANTLLAKNPFHHRVGVARSSVDWLNLALADTLVVF